MKDHKLKENQAHLQKILFTKKQISYIMKLSSSLNNKNMTNPTAQKSSADKVFSILGFQYKPLEKQFLEYLNKNGLKKEAKKYPTLPAGQKIRMLDMFAEFLGL